MKHDLFQVGPDAPAHALPTGAPRAVRLSPGVEHDYNAAAPADAQARTIAWVRRNA